jgi:hypothetical protein
MGKTTGNVVALREAVEELIGVLYDLGVDEDTLAIASELPNCFIHTERILAVLKKARDALATPPRNCDVYKTSWDVVTHWDGGLDSAQDIVRMLDWLLAQAKERKGDGDGR